MPDRSNRRRRMIKTVALDSGIRLVMEHMDEVRSVSIGIWCDNGSSKESGKTFGISHYIEHMLFKGTKNRSAFQIVDEIDRIGGQMNAFTGKETTCFYIKSLDEHFDKSADVLTDMICDPLFDKDEMEKEKLVVIEEINMNMDDPDDVALDNLEEIVFKGTGMEHPVLGTKESVSGFTHESLCEYYYDHYTRDSLVISVAGSFDEQHVIEYFESKFNRLNKEQPEADKTVPGDVHEERKITKDIEQAHLAMGLKTFSAADDRRYPLSMLNTIVGGGMSSRLFQNVREKKGLAYSVYSANGFYNDTGMFIISAGIAMDRIDEAFEAIEYELQRLGNEPVGEAEYMSAREQLKSSYIFGQESVQNRMISNGRNLLGLGRCPAQEDVLKDLDAVTLDDIENVKSLIADRNRYSVVYVTGKDK